MNDPESMTQDVQVYHVVDSEGDIIFSNCLREAAEQYAAVVSADKEGLFGVYNEVNPRALATYQRGVRIV